MIQPIYTSVSNADIKPCGKKGHLIKSEPIPLLRDNYLGEYRTELERAKVRKNLGIADEQSLLWGNISGTIEAQKDLVQYIEQKWTYTSDVAENINTVKDALDYALFFISQYEANTEEIEEIKVDISNIRTSIQVLGEDLKREIDTNREGLNNLSQDIIEINQAISDLNTAIENIDVDKNILNWIKNNLQNSKTVEIKEDNTIEVILSKQDDNAIHLIEQELPPTEEGEEPSTITLPGIYVKNLEPQLEEAQKSIGEVQKAQEETDGKVSANSESITNIQTSLETIATYQTELPNDTTSTVIEGTTVEKLKGKPFNEIIDTLLFPTVVRDLIYPQLYYSFTSQIVEVGTALLTPTLTFVKNDAGEETDREEVITYNGSPIESATYDSIGTYTHSGTVNYAAGEYLVNNKGEVTDKRVEAGSISATAQVTATYPWYSGNTDGLIKQSLVPFNQASGTITFSLSGKAIIKLPGSNTQLNSFTVDGGLGYLNVDLNGWEASTEQINGFPYKVWTKKDTYSSALPHQINFILSQ